MGFLVILRTGNINPSLPDGFDMCKKDINRILDDTVIGYYMALFRNFRIPRSPIRPTTRKRIGPPENSMGTPSRFN